MGKEKEPKFIQTDDGYSEKALDLAVDKTASVNQVKPARHASQLAGVAGRGGNIFDPQKKSKKSKVLAIDSQNQ